MEKGKYYHVIDESGFWMIGLATSNKHEKESSDSQFRANATYITKERKFLSNSLWCYIDTGRTYKEATLLEIAWLNACINANKFISESDFLKQHNPIMEIFN